MNEPGRDVVFSASPVAARNVRHHAMTNDNHWMALALEQARAVRAEGDVPAGAVIVRDDELITTGRIGPRDPATHGEGTAVDPPANSRAITGCPGPSCSSRRRRVAYDAVTRRLPASA